jgi:hypothetical protein
MTNDLLSKTVTDIGGEFQAPVHHQHSAHRSTNIATVKPQPQQQQTTIQPMRANTPVSCGGNGPDATIGQQPTNTSSITIQQQSVTRSIGQSANQGLFKNKF